MDSSIKTLTITGAAAVTGSADPKKPRRGISRRKHYDDETQIEDSGQLEPQQHFQIEKVTPAQAQPRPQAQAQPRPQPRPQAQAQPRPHGHAHGQTQAPVQVQPQVQTHVRPLPPRQIQAQVQALTQNPVAQDIKPISSVILNPPKVQRVKLQPKITAPKQIAGTRKARRISLSLSNLNHRFTRAKKVRDETEKKSIEAIRTYLIEKGVIQMKSRAPEKMLRSMFNDFNMLKDEQAM
jgi:hypothetical protein